MKLFEKLIEKSVILVFAFLLSGCQQVMDRLMTDLGFKSTEQLTNPVPESGTAPNESPDKASQNSGLTPETFKNETVEKSIDSQEQKPMQNEPAPQTAKKHQNNKTKPSVLKPEPALVKRSPQVIKPENATIKPPSEDVLHTPRPVVTVPKSDESSRVNGVRVYIED
jgi:hypothetical protein